MATSRQHRPIGSTRIEGFPRSVDMVEASVVPRQRLHEGGDTRGRRRCRLRPGRSKLSLGTVARTPPVSWSIRASLLQRVAPPPQPPPCLAPAATVLGPATSNSSSPPSRRTERKQHHPPRPPRPPAPASHSHAKQPPGRDRAPRHHQHQAPESRARAGRRVLVRVEARQPRSGPADAGSLRTGTVVDARH